MPHTSYFKTKQHKRYLNDISITCCNNAIIDAADKQREINSNEEKEMNEINFFNSNRKKK